MEPEVNAIARILANVDRKRLGYECVTQLEDLEPADASYYRELAEDVLERADEDSTRPRGQKPVSIISAMSAMLRTSSVKSERE